MFILDLHLLHLQPFLCFFPPTIKLVVAHKGQLPPVIVGIANGVTAHDAPQVPPLWGEEELKIVFPFGIGPVFG